MQDRRTELADAALAVVAAKGLKGLTHRAVDAQAGVAVGTTSNYFRSRAALIGAAVDRVEERDRLLLQQGGREIPTSVATLAEQIAGAVMGLAHENAELTRARFAFALDQPDVVAAGHERWYRPWRNCSKPWEYQKPGPGRKQYPTTATAWPCTC